MSHASGIRPSSELTSTFNSLNSNLRALKVGIENESLILKETIKVVGSWNSDLALIQCWFESSVPCFVLYLLDSFNIPQLVDNKWINEKSESNRWMLFVYIPDTSKVRDKMIYASSKSTLLKDLGDSMFAVSISGSIKSDFSDEGIKVLLI